MIPKRAIELSIEGGWISEYPQAETWLANYEQYRAILDPLFWQALSKALGWPAIVMVDMRRGHELSETGWVFQAHRFYDLILTGGDVESYWKEILQNK